MVTIAIRSVRPRPPSQPARPQPPAGTGVQSAAPPGVRRLRGRNVLRADAQVDADQRRQAGLLQRRPRGGSLHAAARPDPGAEARQDQRRTTSPDRCTTCSRSNVTKEGKRMQASLETELADAAWCDLLAGQDELSEILTDKTATAGRRRRRRHGGDGAARGATAGRLAGLPPAARALLARASRRRIRRRQHPGRGRSICPRRSSGLRQQVELARQPRPTAAAAEPCQLGDRPADPASPFPTPGDYRDRGATPADIWREAATSAASGALVDQAG